MFKCKISLADYDKNDKSAPNVELPLAKKLAKASVKKLATKIGEKTDFYLTKDYFENKGKPIGHFLAIGVSKKLAKQFVMKEMKGKGVATDVKSAATGTVCIKNIGGVDKLCFEPNAKCKIPAAQWPKLLKALKAFFAGYKAVVVVEGKTVEEEPGGEEDTSTDADDDVVFEDDNDIASDDADLESETEAESEEAPSPQNLDTLKLDLKGILDAVRTLATTDMAAIKAAPSAKAVMDAWKKGQDITTKAEAWVKSAASIAALAKETAAANTAKDTAAKIIAQLQPQIDKINAKQGEKSTAEMDGLQSNIAGMIDELFKNYGAEFDNLPGVKDALASFKQ